MTLLQFTDSFENGEDFDSEAVDVLWYNRNTKTLYVEWCEGYDVYQYDNVPVSDFDTLVEVIEDEESVGSAVAALKRQYGPGTNLGGSVEPSSVLPKSVNAFGASTAEYSLQPPVAPVTSTHDSDSVFDAAATQEFSLQTPAAARKGGVSLGSGEYGFTLFFTVNEDGQERSHALDNAKSFDEAVSELESFAESAGIDVVIHKVVAELV